MRVTVRLIGGLRDYLAAHIDPFDEAGLELPDGQTVGQLASELGFRDETVFIALRNGEHVPTAALDETTLADGDSVVFVPPIKGG